MPVYEYALVDLANTHLGTDQLNMLGKKGFSVVAFDHQKGVFTLCREIEPQYEYDCIGIVDLTEAAANGWTFVEIVAGADYSDASVLVRRPVQSDAEQKPAKAAFKVGDVVAITCDIEVTTNFINAGTIGKIVNTDLGDLDGLEYLIETKTTTQIWSAVDEIRLATDAEKARFNAAAAQSVKFKIGDMVILTADNNALKAGEIGRVNEIDLGDELEYLVQTTERLRWASANALRLATGDELIASVEVQS